MTLHVDAAQQLFQEDVTVNDMCGLFTPERLLMSVGGVIQASCGATHEGDIGS